MSAQDLEVMGKAKITNMGPATSAAQQVGQEPDGTLTIISGAKVNIGDIAHGGIVFYVDASGQHGLVADDVDLGTQRWHAGTNGNTHAKNKAIYGGQMNTAIIIAAQVAIGDDGGSYAAKTCMQSEKNGFGDWYLPSPEELLLMQSNLHAQGLGGFTNTQYWSSRETTSTNSMLVNFADPGVLFNNGKAANYRVRAVRRF